MVDNERMPSSASAPTLLGNTTANGTRAVPSSRILASLEGRAPDTEVKHMPAPRQGKAALKWGVAVVLIAGGVALWVMSETPSTVQQAQTPVAAPAVATVAPPQVTGTPSGGDALGDLSDLRPAPGGLPGLEQDDRPRNAFAALQPSVPAARAGMDAAEAQPSAEASREASPAAVAAIIDDYAAQNDDGRAAVNPLAILSASPAKPEARTAASAPRSPPPRSAAPTRQNAQAQQSAAAQTRVTPPGSQPPRLAPVTRDAGTRAVSELSGQTPLRGAAKDSDVKVLANVMSYGLPPAVPPGALVYKEEGVFKSVLPRATLSDRLAQCRGMGFGDAEQCRLQACEGHWGATPQCPAANAAIEP